MTTETLQTRTLQVVRASQYQSGGNTRFVLLAREQTPEGFERHARVHSIRAEDCQEEVRDTLALLQPEDSVTLGYTEHQDMGCTVRLYRKAVAARMGENGVLIAQ